MEKFAYMTEFEANKEDYVKHLIQWAKSEQTLDNSRWNAVWLSKLDPMYADVGKLAKVEIDAWKLETGQV